jgi:hypothetical protein
MCSGRTVMKRLKFRPRLWAAKYHAEVGFQTVLASMERETLRRPILRFLVHVSQGDRQNFRVGAGFIIPA